MRPITNDIHGDRSLGHAGVDRNGPEEKEMRFLITPTAKSRLRVVTPAVSRATRYQPSWHEDPCALELRKGGIT